MSLESKINDTDYSYLRTVANFSVYRCLLHGCVFWRLAHSCWPISALHVGVVELLSMTSNEILYGRETS